MFNQISKLKEFRESNIFSTQVSSLSQIDNQSITEPKDLNRISSKFIDQPRIHLKKIKIVTKQLQSQVISERRNIFRVKNSLQAKYRQISLSRNDFLKLYSAKKCKKQIKELKDWFQNERQFNTKQNLYKIKKQRYGEEIGIIIRKQQTEKMGDEIRDKNSEQRKNWKQQLLENQLRFSQTIYDKIKKRKQERLQAQIRKKNFSQLSTTRSKFNYLSKINQEMQAIINYQQLLDNPEQLIAHKTTRTNHFSNTFSSGFRTSLNRCQ